MSLTTAMQTAAALMIIAGSALLAFATPGRLVVIGGVMIVAALQIWHDRRVTRHHGREVRREARYGDIVHKVMARREREEVARLADRQATRSIHR